MHFSIPEYNEIVQYLMLMGIGRQPGPNRGGNFYCWGMDANHKSTSIFYKDSIGLPSSEYRFLHISHKDKDKNYAS